MYFPVVLAPFTTTEQHTLFPDNLHIQINLQLFNVYSILFRLIDIKVRVWESSKPFSFLVGPHVYKISHLSVQVRAQKGASRENDKIGHNIPINELKANYNYSEIT